MCFMTSTSGDGENAELVVDRQIYQATRKEGVYAVYADGATQCWRPGFGALPQLRE